MCGIAGILALHDAAPPPPRDGLEAMVASLRHRGPDEAGLYRDRWAGLAHARLSIIDLAAGQQPMSDERGTLWITFNGEIFNHPDLREELVARGHRFRTRSDTEVIVQAYREWGEDAFRRFNGQFALALWDADARTLVLARDRLGVRPLYLTEHDGRLWFASEVKALFAADPSMPRALDPVGLAETFTFWAPAAPQTVFRGITELDPGHVRTIGPGGTRDVAFWTPAYAAAGPATRPSAADIDGATEQVRAALEEAVRLRMVRADVPVGSYLSGGLDSSLVAAMGRHAAQGRFRTFSFRFEDAEFDETPYQHEMAAHLGSDHSEILVRYADIAAVFPDVIAHAERPILRTAPAPMFLLSRLAHASGIKVVLTGEGADEMFAGYDLFREGRVRRFWARRPDSRMRPALLRRLYPYLARSPVAQQALAQQFFGQGLDRWREPGFAHQPRWRSAAALQRLFSAGMREALGRTDVVARLLGSLPDGFATWTPLAQDQHLEVRTLLSGYVLAAQGDRMLMANSVEGRFPFLDRDVVDLANALPPEVKLLGLEEKHVLRRVARGLLPERIIARSKQPVRAPDAICFLQPDRPAWVEGVLARERVLDAGIFDPDVVGALWRKVQRADGSVPLSQADNMALVGVLSTGLLHERFIRSTPDPGPVPLLGTDVDRHPQDGRDVRGPSRSPEAL